MNQAQTSLVAGAGIEAEFAQDNGSFLMKGLCGGSLAYEAVG